MVVLCKRFSLFSFSFFLLFSFRTLFFVYVHAEIATQKFIMGWECWKQLLGTSQSSGLHLHINRCFSRDDSFLTSCCICFHHFPKLLFSFNHLFSILYHGLFFFTYLLISSSPINMYYHHLYDGKLPTGPLNQRQPSFDSYQYISKTNSRFISDVDLRYHHFELDY